MSLTAFLARPGGIFMNLTKARISEYFASIGARGGKSRSAAKVKAAKKNARKAREARRG